MSSSPARASRKQEIPASLMLNWQSSAVRGTKSSVRRPKTACERCRLAKVRCHGDGQHECNRCTSRGLSCTYTQRTPASRSASPQSRPGQDPDRTRQDDVPMDSRGNLVDRLGDDDATFQQLLGSSGDGGWSNMNDAHPPETTQSQHMDWGPTAPILDWTPGISPSMGFDLSGTLPSTLSSASNTLVTATTRSTSASGQQPSLSDLGFLSLVNSTAAADLPWQNQLTSQSCQCRSGLALLIPNARAALKERQLDAVCQVTGDVIQRCQEIVGCKGCNVNCTDLICIMAVFQEADLCFEYIAKGDIDGPISVSMGSYEMSVDGQDAKQWRRILVSQLVKRANELLNAISVRGQGMLEGLDPGCRLGRVNIEYLEAVIGNSRDNLQHIMKGFRAEASGTAA